VLNKFNIDLLARRLVSITDWILQNSETRDFSVGYFGASTGDTSEVSSLHSSNHEGNYD
jgi:putative phosphoribosyl transferase